MGCDFMEQEMLYIQTVYKLGSFSKAARALFMTQPALSMAVQRVEARIGMPIFDRNQKPLQLTEAGKLYMDKALQIGRLEEELETQLHELKNGDSGELLIGATHYFNSRILPPVLQKYMDAYPAIHIELQESGAQELLGMLSEQKIDLSFASRRPGTENYLHFPAFQDHILLAVPAMHRINHQLGVTPLSGLDVIKRRHLDPSYPAVDLASFAEVPFILLTGQYDLRKRSEIFFKTAGITPKVCLGVDQFITAYHMARAGIGVTFIYDRSIQDTGRDLCYYKLPYPESTRDVDIVLNKKRYVSRPMRLFTEMLQAHYRE